MTDRPLAQHMIVNCPICSNEVLARDINHHIDSGCKINPPPGPSTLSTLNRDKNPRGNASAHKTTVLASIFNKRAEPGKDADIHGSMPGGKRPAATDIYTHGPPVIKRARLGNLQAAAPLPERMRPQSVADFIGQRHLVETELSLLGGHVLGSVIFWGPPGCGKTTLARLIAKETDAIFKELSATGAGIHDVRAVMEEAKTALALTGRKSIVFLDEVHRFNKAQQDIFLPYLEQGSAQLVGATTENPSFKLTAALLSRCRVIVLKQLSEDEIKTVLKRALARISDPHADLNFPNPQTSPEILGNIALLSGGDARKALSLLELVVKAPNTTPEPAMLAMLRQSVSTSYDRGGDDHYDMISALHKSVRGGKGSAAMYWLARMLNAGEDPLFIARRMVVCASEDIGLADAQALPLAIAAFQACQVIGMPECRINLAHLVAYLAEAPKSTRAYEAYKSAEAIAKASAMVPVPLSMRNAPTELMKGLGYGESYRYNPEYAHPVHNTYLPTHLQNHNFLKKPGDVSGKIWDEEGLKCWEKEENAGLEWDGRLSTS